ncbi:MAG: DUF2520 domain-containing protein [Acidobacteriota bacterium]|nr:MAG: DUF2520 domain-containing protein [Acidobacteriota bacterium]
MRKICVIGPGRAGGALAVALSKAGANVSHLVTRTRAGVSAITSAIGPPPAVLSPDEIASAEPDIYLITVNDEQIESVARSISARADVRDRIALHVSGSRSSSVLSALSDAGASVGSMHPLVSISDPLIGSSRFQGVYFCVEGDPEAVAAARELAGSLGGVPFEIPTEKKPLYHASAVVASGHLVALIDSALDALAQCGLSAADGRRVLLPLIESTVENLKTQTPAEALTGTFARADAETFEAHLAAVEGGDLEEFRTLYLLLGLRSLKLAEEHGADPVSVSKMRKHIEFLLEEGSA